MNNKGKSEYVALVENKMQDVLTQNCAKYEIMNEMYLSQLAVALTVKGSSVPARNGLKNLADVSNRMLWSFSGLFQGDKDQSILVKTPARFSARF